MMLEKRTWSGARLKMVHLRNGATSRKWSAYCNCISDQHARAHGTWHMAHGTWHMAHGTWHMDMVRSTCMVRSAGDLE
jgi:hypothetical protein